MTTTTTKLTAAQKRAATIKANKDAKMQADIEARALKAAENAIALSAFLAENEAMIAETTIVMTNALLAGADLIFSTVEFKDKWARAEARINCYDFGFCVEDRSPTMVRLEVTMGYSCADKVPTAKLNWSSSGTQNLDDTHNFASMLSQFAVLGSKLEGVMAPVTEFYAQDYRIVAEACNRTAAVVRPKVKAMMDDVRARMSE